MPALMTVLRRYLPRLTWLALWLALAAAWWPVVTQIGMVVPGTGTQAMQAELCSSTAPGRPDGPLHGGADHCAACLSPAVLAAVPPGGTGAEFPLRPVLEDLRGVSSVPVVTARAWHRTSPRGPPRA